MPPPLSLTVKALAKAEEVSGSVAYTLPFGDPPNYHFPKAGQVMVAIDAGVATIDTPGWTFITTLTDGRGEHYGIHTKVSDGTETSLHVTGWTYGIYKRMLVVAYTPGIDPNIAMGTVTTDNPGIVDPYTTLDVDTLDGLYNARMDMVTGTQAVSDVPRPEDYGHPEPGPPDTGPNIYDWRLVDSQGNTATGPGTQGIWVRYNRTGDGEPWSNPTGSIAGAMSFAISLPGGGWEINKIGMV
jgi:hypothetical protein